MIQLVVKEFKDEKEFLDFTPKFPVSFKWYDGTMDTLNSYEEWKKVVYNVIVEGALAPISAHVPWGIPIIRVNYWAYSPNGRGSLHMRTTVIWGKGQEYCEEGEIDASDYPDVVAAWESNSEDGVNAAYDKYANEEELKLSDSYVTDPYAFHEAYSTKEEEI